MGTKTFNNYEDLLTFTRASKGHALRPVSYGSEEVTNGTFDSDTTGWAAARCTAAVSSGQVVLTSTDTNPVFTQTLNLTIGKLYRVEGDIIGSTGTAVPQINMFDSGFSSYDNLSASGSFSFIPTTATNYLQLRVQGTTVGDTATFDNISVKEVTFDQPDGTLTLFEHPDNIPRVEWDADRNRLGLLVEESRTNLLPYSTPDSNWTPTFGSQNYDEAVSPDGTKNATEFVPDATSTTSHYTYEVTSSILSTSTTYTLSAFLKANGYNYARLDVYDATSGNQGIARFNLADGTVVYEDAGTTGTIQDFGNGWYRCSLTLTTDATLGTNYFRIFSASEEPAVSFSGDGTKGIYIYGAQVETGSFPTSYIKTTGATATRSADLASIPVADFGFNTGAGTFVAEFDFKDPNNDDANYAIGGTASARIFYNNPSQDAWQTYDGTAGVSFGLLDNTGASRFKAAVGVKTGKDVVAVLDGDIEGSSTSATSLMENLAGVTLYVGGGSTQSLNGHIKSIQYYPRRLTNAQLQALTEPRSTPTLSLTFDGLESSYTENYIHG